MKMNAAWVARMKQVSQETFAHNELIPIISNMPPKYHQLVADAKKKAAVFIPLCNRHGVPSVLFTVRSKEVGTHKGQVSFPGGHLEEGEHPIQAAQRETYEELGPNIGDLHVISLCQTIPAITGTAVTPVIGFIEEDVGNFEHFSPSPGEVDRVFTRSLEQLLEPGYKRYEMLSRDKSGKAAPFPTFGGGGKVVPATEDAALKEGEEGGWGSAPPGHPTIVYDKESIEYEERIWGLTAMILDAVLKHVVVPTQPPKEP
jgi:8-oxo-dGTP pyrophosphatase MutT (NUDIX family)